MRHFNYHLSRLRVRSEHTFGLLKGRFQSLKEIRIKITDQDGHRWAMVWILSCLILHNIIILIEGDTGSGVDSFDDIEGRREAGDDDDDAEALDPAEPISDDEWNEFTSSVRDTYLLPEEQEGESRPGYIFRLRLMRELFESIGIP